MSQNPIGLTSNSKNNSYRIDWFQFIIALVVVVSFTVFVMRVIWNNPTFDESYKIIALVAPFVGTIIGFYFGQRPVQNLTKEVAETTSDNKEITRALQSANMLNTLNEQKIEKLEDDLRMKNQFIESLKNDFT